MVCKMDTHTQDTNVQNVVELSCTDRLSLQELF